MTIRLYDTAARKKRVFQPQDPARVTMYVCGPTVYNYAHIGNARPPIVFDVLRRLLMRVYGDDAVIYARNITDIEDKIIKASLESGEPIAEITKKFADIYNADTTALNVLAPSIEPWATDHVGEMIEMIEKLAALLCARAHFIFSIYLATYSSNSNSNRERFGIPTVIWHILYARTYGDQPIASTSS